MLALVGVMSSTPVRTFKAGRTVVAPNGDIKADIDTRKMIHVFIRELNTEYGGPETCRCSVSCGLLFSKSSSCDVPVSCSIFLSSSEIDIALAVLGKRSDRAAYDEKKS